MNTHVETAERNARPRVVIVGGGFGGLRCAHALRDAPVEVLVIDRTNHWLFQPLLYQVATSALSAEHIAVPIRTILRRQRNATVVQGEVTGVDAAQGLLYLHGSDTPVGFDYLVCATGVGHGYFGHDEYERFAPSLKSLDDAIRIRNKILTAFEAAERKLEPALHPELITFVVVGGGATGVELAGAIAELAHHTLTSEFRRYDPRSLRVILMEAGPRLFPNVHPSLSEAARARLERMGVEVRTNCPVEHVDEEGVVARGERVPCRNVFWAAGVTASPPARWLGAPADWLGRVEVLPDCSVPGHDGIFVIGDAAHFTPAGETAPLPMVAQVAMQQGTHVGRLIARRVRGQDAREPFRYFDKGFLATVGRNFAVLEGFGLRTAGFAAALVWAFIHIQFLALANMRIRTMFVWLWTYVTEHRIGRLIIEPVPGEAVTEASLSSPDDESATLQERARRVDEEAVATR